MRSRWGFSCDALREKIYRWINVKRTFFSSSLKLAHSILEPSDYSIHAFLPTRENEGEQGGSQALPTDARNQSGVRGEGDDWD